MQKVRQLVGLGTEYGEGEYAFMTVQPDTGNPVGYRTCEPIEVVVNPEGAPGNWSDLVDTASTTSSATSSASTTSTTRTRADARRATGQTSFGPGDLEGLSILGDLAC